MPPPHLQSIGLFRSAAQLAAASTQLTPPQLACTLAGHSNYVHCVGVSSDANGDGERIVSASSDKTARVWSAATGRKTGSLVRHSGGVCSVAVFFDGVRAVSGGDHRDKTVRIWRLDSGSKLRVMTGHTNNIWALAVSPSDDCTLASASEDKTVRLWNADTGQCLGTLRGHRSGVMCVALSAGQRRQ